MLVLAISRLHLSFLNRGQSIGGGARRARGTGVVQVIITGASSLQASHTL
jgi:hypothetical protein